MTLPVVFVPGLLCDADLWAAQLAIVSADRPVVVANIAGADTVAALARAVLADAPQRFALAGLSMGGYVALEIMRQAPGRVAGLALLDTSARPDSEEQTRRRRALLALARTGRFKGVTPRLLPTLLHPDRLADPILTGRVMAMAGRIGRDAFLRQQTAILGRPDSRPDLMRIDCPTLVACGRQDALTPLPLSEEMAGLIPGAELVVVEDSGHLSPMERPDAVNAALASWLGLL
ncbi:pimeloyl-ACP methyl ester carboxylesterase [Inquilinus ginsengisoli]|uniref:Pimeloyl-ACP methyl ester carboxylesterase n=1 Tax=Inquilinus ginsengisoli TaxID=363840 RepID=A0ABU1JJJ6_9PROT|nr:alpha/beta hydrolase [Inquilinus ginsengisoli]MDR6288791.1 pimeloyl-ACP methyl ester carboxylesterase [Inquilinus ginsengisoli]